MNLLEAVVGSLRGKPAKVVCRDAERALTAEQVLGSFRSAGEYFVSSVAARRIGILLPNCALYPAAVFGAIWAGKVPVPLNPLLKANELDFIFKEAGIDTVVVGQPTLPTIAELGVRSISIKDLVNFQTMPCLEVPSLQAGDVAVLLYTSGTTGRPKGVPLTHGNLLSDIMSFSQHLAVHPDDVVLSVLPMFHAFGLSGLMIGPLLTGIEAVFAPRFVPERIVNLMARHKVTIFFGVPSMYRLLLHSKVPVEPLQQLRLAISGGDALPAVVRDGYRKRFDRDLLEGYGLTETSPVISVNTPGDNRPGTAGQVLPGVKVRIQDEAGELQPPGLEGEIQVHGPTVMAGYFNRPDENSLAFTTDGWFRTGDLGCLDKDGYLSVTGRIKEIIVRDGEKVMPREVEELLEQNPRVLDVAVIGEPDGKHGEAVVAFVVPAERSVSAEELRESCRSRLADYKVPRRFVIAQDFPRGPTGKILKRALKEWKNSSVQ